MKKILLFITLAFISFGLKAQCDFTLNLIDDFGDGWNGGQNVAVDVNGSISNFTVTGTTNNQTLTLNTGDVVDISLTGGPYTSSGPDWNSEVIIELIDPNSISVFSVTDPAPGSLFNGTITCPSCSTPSALTNTLITATDASFTWVAPTSVPAGGYDYEVRTSGAAGSGPTGLFEDGNLSDTTVSITGLTGGVPYVFYVRSNCSGTESPWISLPFSFVLGNNCASVIDLGALTSPLSASTSQAGVTNDFSFCFMGSANDLIYSIEVPDGSSLSIGQTTNNYDSRHTLRFGGACPGTTEIVCTDDSDTQTETWTNTTGSTQTVYWINSGFGSGAGNFTLAWSILAPVENDSCIGALPISCGTTVSGNTSTATPHTPTCTGNATAPGIWYSFTGVNSSDLAALAGTPGDQVTMSTCDQAGYDTKIDIYTGSCGTLTCVAGNDDGTGCIGFTSEISFATVVGEEYFVFVSGFSGGSSGSFDLTMTCDAPCLPVPSNEVCASAEVLTVQADPATSTAGFNSCASNALTNPGCVSSFASFNDVWYEFEATDGNHDLRITWDTASTVELGVALYEGACGSTDIGCIPPGTLVSGEDILLTVDSGSTYRLQIFSTTAGSGDFDVVVWENPCPFPTALNITNVTTTTADVSWTENGDATTWDLYYGPTPLVAPVDTTTPTETGVSPNNSYQITGLDGETEYALYVRSVCNSTWFGFATFTTLAPPPANDECDNAVSLNVNSDFSCTDVTSATTSGATASSQATTGLSGTSNNDVWFSFTATESEHRISLLNRFNVGGGTSTSIDMGMGLYDATAGCLSATFVGTSDPETWDVSGLTAGTTYFVRVYGWFGTIQNIDFDICVGTPPPPPANDLCENAILVDARSVTTGTNIASSNTGAPTGFCGTTPGSFGVWYAVMGTGGEITASTCNSADFDTKINIYSGSCGSLVCVDGNDDGGGCAGFTSEISFASLQGEMYFIYVTGFGTASGDFELTLDAECATTASLDAPDLRLYCAGESSLETIRLNGYVETAQWIKNGNAIAGATSTQFLLNRWQIGTFSATATCDGNDLATNDIVVNTIQATFENGEDAHYNKVCLDDTTILSATELAGATYEWRVRPSGAVVSTDRLYSITGFSGALDVFVTSPTGCTRSKKVRILPENEGNCAPIEINPTLEGFEDEELAAKKGVENTMGDVVLNFYPNPVSSFYNINLSGLNQDETFDVSWYDLAGRQVSSISKVVTGTGTEVRQSVDNLPSGMYIIQVSNPNHRFTFKVMVK